ncbi:hypothetical protein KVV02_000235 [Mortierella alpina]|uniref:Uncharacterized protein n=1 Tax=Mortierella alpina TaxID=64518 RepID=A0A9P8D3L0_MORAP|nr:hypothetical protein KVV02_000235 [Mortierella alpina]
MPTRAIQQWQCAQHELDLQYIPPPPSVPTKPALVQYPQHDLQDERVNYHDHLDHHAFYHDQRRSDSQDDPDYYDHTADYSAMYHNRYLNDPQPSYGDYDDEDYLTVNRHPRINAPQKYGHSFNEEDVSFSNNQRRLDPQDHTRRSTASQLEFYQARPFNSPQDYGNKVGRDHSTPHQEIRRIRGQQEEYMLR